MCFFFGKLEHIGKYQIIKFIYQSRCLFIQKQLMKNQEVNKQQKVLEDHQCAICLGVFYKPLRLVKCKHIFCENCLTEAALIVQNRRCPLCRTQFIQSEIIPETEFWNILQARYPNSIKQKKKIIKERTLARFLIGNTTQFLQTNEDNKYRWTLFVRPAPGDQRLSKNIKRIDLKLHPTFNPSTVSYPITDNRTVELSRIGWGTFRIGIQIYWKDQYQQQKSEIYHDLEFQPLVERIVHTTLTLK